MASSLRPLQELPCSDAEFLQSRSFISASLKPEVGREGKSWQGRAGPVLGSGLSRQRWGQRYSPARWGKEKSHQRQGSLL